VVKRGAPPESDWPYSDKNPGPVQKKPSAKAFRDSVGRKDLTYKRIVLGGPALHSGVRSSTNCRSSSAFSVPESFEDGSWDGWGMKGRFWMDYHWFDPNGGLVANFWVIQTVT
jgi:hypothetical protein